MNLRHLPPQYRPRPLGPIGCAHVGVDATKTAARAARWVRANDPDNLTPTPRRTQ